MQPLIQINKLRQKEDVCLPWRTRKLMATEMMAVLLSRYFAKLKEAMLAAIRRAPIAIILAWPTLSMMAPTIRDEKKVDVLRRK